jgi:hypothetical protein
MSDNAKGQATMTRLGRVVRTAGGPARAAEPEHREEHRQANWLRDVILGGQDGLVNILGIILGVIAGGGTQAVPAHTRQGRDRWQSRTSPLRCSALGRWAMGWRPVRCALASR